ncbi:MAG TPA: ERF family protein [Gemmatimonadaceae bacterium]|nr:ERF family protein [Gemmatimonadaceae bacterium]
MADATTTTERDEAPVTDRVAEALEQAQHFMDRPRADVLPPAEAPKRPEVTLAIADMSAEVGELFAALAEAQGEFTEIERTLTAKIKTRSGPEYSYDYAPLSEVLAAVRPALSKNGLALLQFPMARGGSGASVVVRTMLGHASGQWLRNDLTVGCVSTAPQDIGSAITYARRYGLQALLGVSPDYDDDGASATGREQTSAPREAPPVPEDAVRIASCAPRNTSGGGKVYSIKTTTGAECFTEDEQLYQAAVAAMRAEQPVRLTTERRTSGQRQYWRLLEIEATDSAKH